MVGGSFLRQLERDRDRGRQGREGERATGHVMDRWAASRARREGAISRKGQRYSLLHDTMAATIRRCLAARKIESRARWLPAINNAPPVGDCQTVKTGELHNIS